MFHFDEKTKYPVSKLTTFITSVYCVGESVYVLNFDFVFRFDLTAKLTVNQNG